MTGRIYTFDPSAHAAVDALLPWYVNGTLRGDELALVEQHVRGCGQCQREVAWLRDVFSACAALAPLDDVPPKLASASTVVPPRRRPMRAAGARAAWRSVTPWVRGVLAAQLAAIVVLGAVVAADSARSPSYQTLGATARASPARNAVAVVFDPAASEADLRHLVAGAGARIVDGPTATNAYLLELPAAQPEEALRALRASAVVRMAEPLGPAPAGR